MTVSTVLCVGLGSGKTEHAGPRDMSRKGGHWGFTEEAKAWASRARRRDQREALKAELLDLERPASRTGRFDPD
jgi:hypothetical protein